MSFLGRLFSHKRTAIQATDWPQILAKIDEGLGALRPAWFGLCVSLVEEWFSRGANGKIENKTTRENAVSTFEARNNEPAKIRLHPRQACPSVAYIRVR